MLVAQLYSLYFYIRINDCYQQVSIIEVEIFYVLSGSFELVIKILNELVILPATLSVMTDYLKLLNKHEFFFGEFYCSHKKE